MSILLAVRLSINLGERRMELGGIVASQVWAKEGLIISAVGWVLGLIAYWNGLRLRIGGLPRFNKGRSLR